MTDDIKGMVEIEEIQPIINNMHSILFKTSVLSHDDRRNLENLLALLQNKITASQEFA